MPTVLVTGANRGLGLEFVRQYLADGWQVIACCRRRSEQLDALHQASAGALVIDEFALNDTAALEAFAERLGARPVDVLINNAGTMGRGSFATQGLEPFRFGSARAEDWAAVFHLNVFVPMKLSELLVDNVAASEMRRIVTLTSMLGSIATNTVGGLYAYRASKAAVNAMMRSMAIDLAERGIIAIPLHPGWVRTDLGGQKAQLDARASVSGMRQVIATLTPAQAGCFLTYSGETLPW
ncbi:MAG: SDR family oxidoreductase [Gammaproteobacteria bacterium]|nr:SDR family oxidoreductase [Gammaproteobacteria bacterium]